MWLFCFVTSMGEIWGNSEKWSLGKFGTLQQKLKICKAMNDFSEIVSVIRSRDTNFSVHFRRNFSLECDNVRGYKHPRVRGCGLCAVQNFIDVHPKKTGMLRQERIFRRADSMDCDPRISRFIFRFFFSGVCGLLRGPPMTTWVICSTTTHVGGSE